MGISEGFFAFYVSSDLLIARFVLRITDIFRISSCFFFFRVLSFNLMMIQLLDCLRAVAGEST